MWLLWEFLAVKCFKLVDKSLTYHREFTIFLQYFSKLLHSLIKRVNVNYHVQTNYLSPLSEEYQNNFTNLPFLALLHRLVCSTMHHLWVACAEYQLPDHLHSQRWGSSKLQVRTWAYIFFHPVLAAFLEPNTWNERLIYHYYKAYNNIFLISTDLR